MVVLSLEHCDLLIKLACWLGSCAGCLSTLLFLFRVNCVFFDSRPAKILFTSLWILVSLSLLCIPLSYTGSSQEPGGLCVVSLLRRIGSIPSFTVGVFDSTIFISISYRITTTFIHQTWRERCITFVTGKPVGSMSRALVRTGRLYFL